MTDHEVSNHNVIKKNNRIITENVGASTIVVVCVMAIIMALSLGLFVSASVLMKTAGRTLAVEQCRILAVTFSDEINESLTSKEYSYEEYHSKETIWHYVRQNLRDGSWPYLDEAGDSIHSRANAVRSFEMQKAGVTGEIADVTLSMYWLCEPEEEKPSQLVIETQVTVKEQSCKIVDVYTLNQKETDYYDRWVWEHAERR